MTTDLHPNEPVLVFRSSTGKWLPSQAWFVELAKADALTDAHVNALHTQATRQAQALAERAA